MIPSSLLRSVARQLAKKTAMGQVSWQRTDFLSETYAALHNKLRLQLSFFPSRSGGADSIVFEVLDQGGQKVGALGCSEDERELYEPLAELLFAIQRTDPHGQSRAITDALLDLLPDNEKAKWETAGR